MATQQTDQSSYCTARDQHMLVYTMKSQYILVHVRDHRLSSEISML